MRSLTPPPPLAPEDKQRLDELYAMIEREADYFIGYPCNSIFDYSPLFPFLNHPVNNVGDPYVPSNFHLNTHTFEREVLEIFQQLTHIPEDQAWGYISCGGTEGNMYGIFLGRELYPEGLVYYSEDTHYSVNKILRCLHVRNIMIKSNADGTMDLEDLRETINIHRDVPPIIFTNVGTTMKGAVDDLAGIRQILDELAIHRSYLHADAALSGMILPFVDDPQPWDFRAGLDSISISGHKMIGAPIPCGVVLAKRNYVDRIARSIEYVGTMDTTILGSRNAIAPLFLWYAFRTMGLEGCRERVLYCFDMAEYTISRLNEVGCNAWRHPNSVTVVFDRPDDEVVSRWQLAVQGNIAHVITMPHVTSGQIDRLVNDIAASQAATDKEKTTT